MGHKFLADNELAALATLLRYGSVEDCRAGLSECAAFETLELKGMVRLA